MCRLRMTWWHANGRASFVRNRQCCALYYPRRLQPGNVGGLKDKSARLVRIKAATLLADPRGCECGAS
jgi:hypothetical protein